MPALRKGCFCNLPKMKPFKNKTIKLEEWEIAIGNYIANLRTTRNKKKSRFDRNEKINLLPRNRVDELGALGELVVCKCFNYYWYGAFFSEREYKDKNVRPRDAGPYEVKTTTRRQKELFIYRDTPSDARCILIYRHSGDTYEICGWTYARDAKKPEFWNDKLKLPCWAYPEKLLKGFYERK